MRNHQTPNSDWPNSQLPIAQPPDVPRPAGEWPTFEASYQCRPNPGSDGRLHPCLSNQQPGGPGYGSATRAGVVGRPLYRPMSEPGAEWPSDEWMAEYGAGIRQQQQQRQRQPSFYRPWGAPVRRSTADKWADRVWIIAITAIAGGLVAGWWLSGGRK